MKEQLRLGRPRTEKQARLAATAARLTDELGLQPPSERQMQTTVEASGYKDMRWAKEVLREFVAEEVQKRTQGIVTRGGEMLQQSARRRAALPKSE